jgi:hypothetical protein
MSIVVWQAASLRNSTSGSPFLDRASGHLLFRREALASRDGG